MDVYLTNKYYGYQFQLDWNDSYVSAESAKLFQLGKKGREFDGVWIQASAASEAVPVPSSCGADCSFTP